MARDYIEDLAKFFGENPQSDGVPSDVFGPSELSSFLRCAKREEDGEAYSEIDEKVEAVVEQRLREKLAEMVGEDEPAYRALLGKTVKPYYVVSGSCGDCCFPVSDFFSLFGIPCGKLEQVYPGRIEYIFKRRGRGIFIQYVPTRTIVRILYVIKPSERLANIELLNKTLGKFDKQQAELWMTLFRAERVPPRNAVLVGVPFPDHQAAAGDGSLPWADYAQFRKESDQATRAMIRYFRP